MGGLEDADAKTDETCKDFISEIPVRREDGGGTEEGWERWQPLPHPTLSEGERREGRLSRSVL